jgi:hypothetical protein
MTYARKGRTTICRLLIGDPIAMLELVGSSWLPRRRRPQPSAPLLALAVQAPRWDVHD